MGYPNGLFGWADVAVPDTAAGRDFYTSLFGWDAAAGSDDASMPYTIFSNQDGPVAGMGPLTTEQQKAGQPPVWSSYVMVDDADATAAKATSLGATLLMEPFDVPNAGRMFFAIDPVGAVIGFWQAGEFGGAGVFNEPGAMSWNELACRDVPAAKEFYSALLGWTTDTQDHDGFTYTTVSVGDRLNGGIYDMTGLLPDEVPAHWFVWFAVSDTDAAAIKASDLGASIIREPWDTMFGRMAVIQGPQGPTFGIVTIPMEH
jgi:predicted enzyme related to lactoylglutathione lyase